MGRMQERAAAIRSALMQDHGIQVTPDMADAEPRAAGD